MNDPDSSLFAVSQRSERWLVERALPLWASSGYDPNRDMFEERLDFSGLPCASAPRRLMVQARQISVYAAAAISGRYPAGAELAARATRSMISTYFERDGRGGWIFATDRSGGIVDARRDLYAHAFVLFALAWVLRLKNDREITDVAAATMEFVDTSFSEPLHGGCHDCLPPAGPLRRQNPHMHLFEAYLALYETTRQDEVLDRCHALHNLALTKFRNPETGVLCEYFDDSWRIHPAPGEGSVEPGHLYEWAWLLRQYERVSGEHQDEAVEMLMRIAGNFGLTRSTGRIVDEIGEDGAVRSPSSRCWAHTEAIKALAEEIRRGYSAHAHVITAVAERLMTVYCRESLRGGWIDHVGEGDISISSFMPASSLYHIYFGISALTALTMTPIAQQPLT